MHNQSRESWYQWILICNTAEGSQYWQQHWWGQRYPCRSCSALQGVLWHQRMCIKNQDLPWVLWGALLPEDHFKTFRMSLAEQGTLVQSLVSTSGLVWRPQASSCGRRPGNNNISCEEWSNTYIHCEHSLTVRFKNKSMHWTWHFCRWQKLSFNPSMNLPWGHKVLVRDDQPRESVLTKIINGQVIPPPTFDVFSPWGGFVCLI